MAIEFWSIAVLALLLLAITAVQGSLVPATQGLAWGLGSRDDPREKSALQKRFDRTVQNHIEAMLMYIPPMGLVLWLGRTDTSTEIAAWLIMVGRVTFIPCYLLGIFGLRSVAYALSMIGIFLTFWALLF